MLCASPDYLARAGVPDSPGALAQHSCIRVPLAGSADRWTLVRGAKRVAVGITGRLWVDNVAVAARAAVAGAGIAALPPVLCASELTDGRLLRVLPQWTLGEVRIAAVYPRDRRDTPALRALLDLLADRLRARLGAVA